MYLFQWRIHAQNPYAQSLSWKPAFSKWLEHVYLVFIFSLQNTKLLSLFLLKYSTEYEKTTVSNIPLYTKVSILNFQELLAWIIAHRGIFFSVTNSLCSVSIWYFIVTTLSCFPDVACWDVTFSKQAAFSLWRDIWPFQNSTYNAKAVIGCVFLCFLLNPSQSAWHMQCLIQFQSVHASKQHDQGQTSSPESSRILMLGFESMHLILTLLLHDVVCS